MIVESVQENAQHTYKKYYIDRHYEQIDLFRLLKDRYSVSNAIYPGSFVQISPSFIFPHVVYIDSDKTAIKFFQDKTFQEIVTSRKEYAASPIMEFHGIDYRIFIEEYRSCFDLLISQYAGFISEVCKPYLRIGGYLLVNNSHGDAGLASIDADYKLISAIHKTSGKYRLSETHLADYFKPKKDMIVTKEWLKQIGKGIGYTRTATLYLFQRLA